MAKRKAYRGLPAEHRKHALSYLKEIRTYMREMAPALKAGRCAEALAVLGQVREAEGSYLAHRGEAGRSRYAGEYALFKRTAKMQRAFRDRCVR